MNKTINNIQENIIVVEADCRGLNEKSKEVVTKIDKIHSKILTKIDQVTQDLQGSMTQNLDTVKANLDKLTEEKNEILHQLTLQKQACTESKQGIFEAYDPRLESLEDQVKTCADKIQTMDKNEGDFTDSKVKEIEHNVTSKIDHKIDYQITLTRNDLNARIDDVEKEVHDLSNSVNERLQNLGTNEFVRPATAHEEVEKKKRVKSAVRRSTNIPNKKLEEMRRWLEYQRRYTAEEIKKRSEHFKEVQESMYPKIDTSVDREASKSDFKRRYTNYENITHPYQSTVDDLLRSRYAGKPDDSMSLPPVKSEDRKASPGKPITLVEFDDLDKIVIHKRK